MLVWFQVPLPVGAPGGIWREELSARSLAIIWNILVPGVCPHLVDRHYKSAKRRHSFEDISQSRGNVVRDNAPDIARRSTVCDVRGRVRVSVSRNTRREVSAGNSKNQKVVDGIANDLSNIRTSDVIGRGNEARRCKISLNKSCIVDALMVAARSAFRVSSIEFIGERCTRTSRSMDLVDYVVNRQRKLRCIVCHENNSQLVIAKF